jgi:hypothetical protein
LHAFQNFHQPIHRVRFHSEELIMASAHENNTVRFWDLESWKEVGRVSLTQSPRTMTFLPESRYLVVGHQRGCDVSYDLLNNFYY